MISALAPAKINLSLHITGKRADGYHSLQSVVTFADWGDRLTLIPSASGPTLNITGPFAAGLSTHKNLTLTALHEICAALHIAPHFSIALEKNIPHGAGLGGGSADAAAVIRLVLQHTNKSVPDETLAPLLASIGSDVPACYMARPLWLEGRGETCTPLPALSALHAVLVCAPITCSTVQMFAAIAPPYTTTQAKPDTLDLVALQNMRNDFEDVALKLFPDLRDVRTALQNTPGVQLARLTGSGACFYGLYADQDTAEKAAHTLQNQYKNWFVRSVCLMGADFV